jgi:signal transduction histidine kinase
MRNILEYITSAMFPMTSDIDCNALSGVEAFPRMLEMLCRATGLGFAAVARVTKERWVACVVKDHINFGIRPGDTFSPQNTIGGNILKHRLPVIVESVVENEQYRGHNAPAVHGFESCVVFPIHWRNGEFFGTLSAVGRMPAKLHRVEIIELFEMFAELIGFHLDALEKLTISECALVSEREQSTLRERSIAILGHDLRNPLASLSAAIERVRQTKLEAKAEGLIPMMGNSIVRMKGLIDSLTDLANARFGQGVPLDLVNINVTTSLEQVINEMRSAWPERNVISEIEVTTRINCDPARIGQLLSNLIANALTHGAADKAVHVIASTFEGQFELSVVNSGAKIPESVKVNLFRPFFRGEMRHGPKGLGLGLYIVSEIAAAHGGSISVFSSEAQTRFTFRMQAGERDVKPVGQ